ncbi:MAG: phosphotransferase [Thermomicrobiales bacterium]|nr:phosphotransferase [Thermomicrobiales bacterium]
MPAPEPMNLPGGAPLAIGEGGMFSARRWVPGEPLGRTSVAYPTPDHWLELPRALPDPAFVAAVEALARLHVIVPPTGAAAPLPRAPLTGFPDAVRAAWQDGRARLRAVAPMNPPVQRWIAGGERLLPAAEAVLAAAPEGALAPRAIVHLNVWPGQFLYEGEDRLTGLVGWSHAAIGAPLLDLAQAIVRLRGWSTPAVELLVGAHGAVRSLDPEERRLLPALGALDLVATASRLLIAAYARPPDAPAPPTALRAGIAHLIDGMDNVALALIQTEGTGKPKRSRPAPSRRRKPAAGPKTRRR